MNLWKKQCLHRFCWCLSLKAGVILILTFEVIAVTTVLCVAIWNNLNVIAEGVLLGLVVLIWIIAMVGVFMKRVLFVLCGEIGYVVFSVSAVTSSIIDFSDGSSHLALPIIFVPFEVLLRTYFIIVIHSMYRKIKNAAIEQ